MILCFFKCQHYVQHFFDCGEKYFGFQNQDSTNHALMEIAEEIKQGFDSGKIALGVFLDFQKAFDTLNHDILLKKLQ